MAGPVALVSGGTRGIGRAVALRLAADGYDVAFCYAAAADAARTLERDIRDLGRRVYARRTDVADAVAVRTLLEGVEDALGPVSALVANAGVVRDGPLMLMDDADWDRVLAVDLTGIYHLCRATVETMVRRKQGAIVTLSSVSGIRGNAGQCNYSAAKAGVIGFTKALAQEVGRYGVRANSVAPGFVWTDQVEALPERLREQALSRVALRRFGRAEEVADLVSYLVSDRASYLTGEVVTLDGGLQ